MIFIARIGSQIQKAYVNDGDPPSHGFGGHGRIIGMIRYIYKNTEEFSHHQRLYYLYDSLGSVSVITGENGLPLQNYTYSPYGSTMNVEYDTINGLRFVGRYGGYKDDDTGLTYFWHRWYSDEDGRWVSRDMIGVLGDINLFRYVDTVGKTLPYLNLYQYTGNWPTYYIDSNGLCPGGPEWQPLPTIPVAPGPAPTQEPPTKTPGPNICDSKEKCYEDCMSPRRWMCGAGCIAVAALTEPATFIYFVVVAGGCDAACLLYNSNECHKKCDK